MKKIESYIFDCIRYDEHEPELMPDQLLLSENDPIVVRDYGNDVDIVCSEKCICEYLGIEEE
jgi:hypothetical protein